MSGSVEPSETEGEVFVGPPNDVSWWKFKLAGIVWTLTRGNPITTVAYIPGVKRAAKWAFEVRVLSRDFEVEGLEALRDTEESEESGDQPR